MEVGTHFGRSYLATIGERYKRQPCDVHNVTAKIPLFQFESFGDFKKNMPEDTSLVGIEMGHENQLLDQWTHPYRAVYLLGAEDNGLPE